MSDCIIFFSVSLFAFSFFKKKKPKNKKTGSLHVALDILELSVDQPGVKLSEMSCLSLLLQCWN